VWVLNAGLAKQAVETVFGPIETKMIEEVIDEEEKPPPPPPKIETTPPPFVPPPDISIDLPVESAPTSAITATTQKPPPKPPPVAAPVARKAPSQNPRRPLPITEEDYPAQSKRLGEEGVTVVRLWVLADGSIGDVQVSKSSGFPRLDETAVRKLKRWRVNPGTENGKPVAMWMDLRVVWKIKDER
jgi:protein TonB